MNHGLILLVEDDENDVFFFERALKKSGVTARCEVLRDGQSALDYFSGIAARGAADPATLPQLVVLDLNLPQIQGLEVLKSIRDIDALDPVPVVVLTSSTSDRDIREAYAMGVNSYLVKPADPDALGELVKLLDAYWLRTNKLPHPF
jgi:two-component system, response regulator